MSSDDVPVPADRIPRPAVLRAERLGKRYVTGRTEGMYRYRSLREDLTRRRRRDIDREFWALRDVSFEVGEGETVGVIGRNGAGKSTLLKLLSRITPPSEGRAEVRGRVGALLEVGTGFHPELTGRDNIFLSGAVLGMRRAEIQAKLDEIIEFSGVEAFLDTPVKRFSSGMYLRLAFAVAAFLEPEILLIDEVLAVGDAQFQKRCLVRMADLASSGRTVLFVSHSMPAVLRLCPRVILLDGGRVIADGPAAEVIRVYLDSGMGCGAVREWPAPEDAPGDDVARLRAVRVLGDHGEVAEEIDITRPMAVEVEYWHQSADPDVRPTVALHFVNEEGTVIFVTADFSDPAWAAEERSPGLVRSTCHIPGNFLAEGRVFVKVVIATVNPTTNHLSVADAVGFQVVDRTSGEGVRGPYVNEWPGVVRPHLDWSVEAPTPARPTTGRA